MNDTPAEIQDRISALFARRSGSDRVRMACEMFDLARALMIGRIRAEYPDISPADLRVKLFERLYGGDLSPEDRGRIIQRLRG